MAKQKPARRFLVGLEGGKLVWGLLACLPHGDPRRCDQDYCKRMTKAEACKGLKGKTADLAIYELVPVK